MAFCHFANLKCRALSLSTLAANKEKKRIELPLR